MNRWSWVLFGSIVLLATVLVFQVGRPMPRPNERVFVQGRGGVYVHAPAERTMFVFQSAHVEGVMYYSGGTLWGYRCTPRNDCWLLGQDWIFIPWPTFE